MSENMLYFYNAELTFPKVACIMALEYAKLQTTYKRTDHRLLKRKEFCHDL